MDHEQYWQQREHLQPIRLQQLQHPLLRASGRCYIAEHLQALGTRKVP